jgi:hypothetical protein
MPIPRIHWPPAAPASTVAAKQAAGGSMREITLGLIGTGFMGKCLAPGEPLFS